MTKFMDSKRLGIIGGGQLGRMTALAAARLGIQCVIFSDIPNSPASQVCPTTIVADYTNKTALEHFANQVDYITYEFENIPIETVRFLQQFKPVHPDDRLLEIAQHRAVEKKYLNDIGIPTTRWASIKNAKDIKQTLESWNAQKAILKTARFGYDGKGQGTVRIDDNFKAVLKDFQGDDFILEEIVDFSFEISVLIARDKIGQSVTYPAVLNQHHNHILNKTIAPAPISKDLDQKARKMAELLADSVNLIGVLAVEFFVTPMGELMANEIAPRPHNSGHWTMDACAVCQFEQHARSVCAYPIADPGRHSDAVMINLIGQDAAKISYFLETPGMSLHLYGKKDIKDGRKMGHINICGPMGEGVDLENMKALRHYLPNSITYP